MDKLILNILIRVLTGATPAIKAIVQKAVQDMVEKAKETPNPLDDVLAMLLQSIVGVPDESTSTD